MTISQIGRSPATPASVRAAVRVPVSRAPYRLLFGEPERRRAAVPALDGQLHAAVRHRQHLDRHAALPVVAQALRALTATTGAHRMSGTAWMPRGVDVIL